MNPAWVTAAIAFATVACGVLVWISRVIWQLFMRTSDFLEDWNGRPETPGHKRIPGAMERLAIPEDKQAQIVSEVSLNSGHSLKDTVQEILRTLNNQQKP